MKKKKESNKKSITKKAKGFSLIELLAAIVILGLVTTVSIVSVSKILDNAKVKYYDSSLKELRLAGQSYYQDNRNKLPKAPGKISKVTLQTLKETKYIGEILDYKKEPCSETESYVNVMKIGNSDYKYIAYLKCNRDAEKIANPPEPSITIAQEINSNDVKIATANITITQNGTAEYPDEEIMSYVYKIYKTEVDKNGKTTGKEQEVYSSGNVLANNKKTIALKDIDLTNYVPGQIRIKVNATNSYGITNSKDAVSTKIYNDTTAPECTVINPIPDNDSSWINTNRTIKVKCDDKKGSGCQRDTYTYTVKKDTKYKNFKVYDNEGNEGVCKNVAVYVDKTAPTCKIDTNGTTGTNGWFKAKDVTLTLDPKDEEYATINSGVSAYDLKLEQKETYNNVKTLTQGDTAGTKYYGYVIDKAGNKGTCDLSIKVDTKSPTCDITKTGTKGENDWYKSNVSLSMTTDDKGYSNVNSYDLVSSNKASYNKTVTGIQKDTTGKTWYGFVKDNAGNTGTCNSGSFKVDTKAPTVTLAFSSTNSNYNTVLVNYTITATDDTSKVSKYCINKSANEDCTPTTNTNKENNISIGLTSLNGQSVTRKACVKDNAGNVGCSSASYATYKECSITTDNGNYSCGSYGACQCPGDKKYATKTQPKKDAKTGAKCDSKVTANGCSASCTCYGTNNCNIIGTTLKYQSYSWSGSCGHTHKSGFTHYCSDSSGNIQTKDSNPGLVTYRWICPYSPDGLDSSWIKYSD